MKHVHRLWSHWAERSNECTASRRMIEASAVHLQRFCGWGRAVQDYVAQNEGQAEDMLEWRLLGGLL